METKQILQEKSSLGYTFKSSSFALMLPYLENVFQHLNDLNLSVQGKRVNIVTTCDLLHAFRQKYCCGVGISCKIILLIASQSNSGIQQLDLEENVKSEISQHLEGQRDSFDRYFFLGDLEEPKT